jgi:hypothetical protein
MSLLVPQLSLFIMFYNFWTMSLCKNLFSLAFISLCLCSAIRSNIQTLHINKELALHSSMIWMEIKCSTKK